LFRWQGEFGKGCCWDPVVGVEVNGHYKHGVDIDPRHRLAAIFTELACAI
jgi:hypothetical protein